MRLIELGSEVVDLVTGFKGIVTSRAIHLNGCDRYWIQPKVGKDGKHPDGIWCDVTTLKVTKGPIKLEVTEEKKSERKPGGFSSTVK